MPAVGYVQKYLTIGSGIDQAHVLAAAPDQGEFTFLLQEQLQDEGFVHHQSMDLRIIVNKEEPNGASSTSVDYVEVLSGIESLSLQDSM
ncbi:hypothetical protein V6N12_062791 [Hibiscus sabdariffa]|uniref:Uncharacterized protein n=1 Tax=Hibiscus sabdariffa TaxID=183260 RepID=A0ABR2F9V3_9ROSI